MAKNIPAVPKEGKTHAHVTADMAVAGPEFTRHANNRPTPNDAGNKQMTRSQKNGTAPISQPALKGTGTGHAYEDNPYPNDKV